MRTSQLLIWLNTGAGWLFLAGLAAAAAINLRRWWRDLAAALGRREGGAEPVPLQATPQVSVLVAAWNEAAIIGSHIESFLSLRYPAKELILCAGGADDTYRIACAYQGPQVIVLEQQPGEGKQRALQRCLDRASGELIFLTDADCLLDSESFEHTLAPLINDGESISTGGSQPLDRQRGNPFVLHLWFIDSYSRAAWGRYTDGLLGRNAALRREALEKIGGFAAEVRTGTDYHMAKELLRHGYRIRYAADSAVQTAYAETLRDYWKQQSRWLRNVVTHGLHFAAYGEVARALLPSTLGAAMLLGLPVGLLLGPAGLAIWALAWTWVLFSRARYMQFGELVTGCSFRSGYLRLPIYTAIDFGVWALTMLQYPVRHWRLRW